jgi:hypothetical protein
MAGNASFSCRRYTQSDQTRGSQRQAAHVQPGKVLKRILSGLVALLTLVGMSIVFASAASASMCQGNGTSCVASGTYSGPNALINADYHGFKVVWTASVVPSYSTIPTPWTVIVTYTNITSSALTLGCPGDWMNASYVWEQMSGGSGDDGGVAASGTNCSENPGQTVTVSPGQSTKSFATFGNVPWPGSTVAIQWGDAGTSPSVTPWTCAVPRLSAWGGYAACGVNADLIMASWAVPPAIPGGKPNSGSAFWVGLGGTGSANLEQTGTASDMVNGKALYFAWYELTPAGPKRLKAPYLVRPGDAISAQVEITNGDQYNFVLADHGPAGSKANKWVFTTSAIYSAGGHNSAEAVAEWASGLNSCIAPGCPLTDFSTVAFSGIEVDGNSIGSYHPSVIQMAYQNVKLSSLRNGTAYTVYFQHG